MPDAVTRREAGRLKKCRAGAVPRTGRPAKGGGDAMCEKVLVEVNQYQSTHRAREAARGASGVLRWRDPGPPPPQKAIGHRSDGPRPLRERRRGDTAHHHTVDGVRRAAISAQSEIREAVVANAPARSSPTPRTTTCQSASLGLATGATSLVWCPEAPPKRSCTLRTTSARRSFSSAQGARVGGRGA